MFKVCQQILKTSSMDRKQAWRKNKILSDYG